MQRTMTVTTFNLPSDPREPHAHVGSQSCIITLLELDKLFQPKPLHVVVIVRLSSGLPLL